MKVSIIVPVYGVSPWIEQALNSVILQDCSNWNLLIADDGSDKQTREWLVKWVDEQKDARIKLVTRSHNIGLFANLNKAIDEAKCENILLLCSDDKLKYNAIRTLRVLQDQWNNVSLILSSFESINSDGSLRPAESVRHHDELALNTELVSPKQMIPALLRLGSLNGNLTGMYFNKRHWKRVGQFRDDWRHAADWEWLIRACEVSPILLNRQCIASVRTHDGQLSVKNRISGHECQEVAKVVKKLLTHRMVIKERRRYEWAGHVMQFQLWNQLKKNQVEGWKQWPKVLTAIHNSAGLRQTVYSLVVWLPTRWKMYRIREQQ